MRQMADCLPTPPLCPLLLHASPPPRRRYFQDTDWTYKKLDVQVDVPDVLDLEVGGAEHLAIVSAAIAMI